MDLSGINSLVVKVKACSDITQISKVVKYSLVLASEDNTIITLNYDKGETTKPTGGDEVSDSKESNGDIINHS